MPVHKADIARVFEDIADLLEISDANPFRVRAYRNRCYVIEVNDNPNVDAGGEDGVLKDALYREIMGELLKRIEERKRVPPR